MTTRSQGIVVAGMHRSGTSALSGALSRLGIALGDSLVPAAGDNPAQLLGNQLGAVTNAQNRNAQLKDFTIKNRGTFHMHACWPARQNDGDWLAGSNLAGRNAVRDDFGIHLCFAHPTSNQLGILRTKINH